jgi:hypothetical protein
MFLPIRPYASSRSTQTLYTYARKRSYQPIYKERLESILKSRDIAFATKNIVCSLSSRIDRVAASHHQRPVLSYVYKTLSLIPNTNNYIAIMFTSLRTHALAHTQAPGVFEHRTGTSERNQNEVCIRIRRFQRSTLPKSPSSISSRPLKGQALHQSKHSVRALSSPRGMRPSLYPSLCCIHSRPFLPFSYPHHVYL